MSLLQRNPEIKSKIDDLWNKFWSGGISNPLTAIEQITYLLFMKILDTNDQEAIANAEFTGEPYTSRFQGKFLPPAQRPRPDKPMTELDDEEKEAFEEKLKRFVEERGIDKNELRWSVFKNRPAEEIMSHIQTYVFPFLKDLNGSGTPFTHHMATAMFTIPKASLVTEAIKSIEGIFELMEHDAAEHGQAFQDIQGDVYEYLLSEIASAGKNGQFRTPRHIIKLLVELVDPQLGQLVADPACGTGGFLLGAYQYVVTQLDSRKDEREPDEDGFIRSSRAASFTEETKEILERSFFGFDIDQSMVRLGLMNLMMHGIDEPQINYMDTLSKKYAETGQYHIVLANPPFTGKIDKADMSEELTLKTTKSELLFIDRIYQMLRPGGTAGIVIPQGVLFSTSKAFQEARKLMIEDSELKAVISAPSGVFKPYAGVSTALLIFTKGGTTENVWFYDMESDGYSLDDKRNKLEGYGDLQDIVTQYQNRDPAAVNDRKGKFFFVPKAEIVNEGYDLSFSRYKTEVYEEIKYEAPELILEKLLGKNGIEERINEGLKTLKSFNI
jgi:type I restriction enzyme M protein